RHLIDNATIVRIGAVVRPGTIGASTLAAVAVPPEKLEDVAQLVSGFDEVNHNYEREHEFNLWFVLTAPDRERIDEVLAEIKSKTGIHPMDLPMEQDYHLDLGFHLLWT
ncbi:MAG: Lrp/AsnC family transcriptional regulator, partial [Rhodospirillaceae bacterium]|nr:Lrp/AsnC family transcriptional regulator [Rhodospirillaceae bacterium]